MRIITLSRQLITHLRQPSRAWLGWLALTIALGATLVRADSPHRVGLVVKHGDTVITRCVEFSEDELTGYEVLKRSGLDIKIDPAGGLGATICRLDGAGCAFPAEDCFCQCQGSPCVFWLYWHLRDGDWQFSSRGASSYKVRDGSVEGWVWGEGSPGGGGDKPPAISFDQICAAPPPDTPTPIPPTPSDTPTPSATATPIPTPVIHNFSASQTAITAGDSVTLSWDLSDATAAFLRANGTEEGVIAPDSRTLAPSTTTVYTLIARNEGGESRTDLTIIVNPAPDSPAEPTPTPPPAVVPAIAAEAAPLPTATTPAPPQLVFKSTAATVPAGACTQLSWDTQQATAVYLDEVEVAARGSQAACPTQTRTYTLHAIGPGGERVAQVALQVEAPLAAGTTPSATPTPILVAAVPATPLPPPARPEARRFSVSIDAEKEAAGPGWLLYGGALAVMLLLLATPAALLIIGGVAWWARGRR